MNTKHCIYSFYWTNKTANKFINVSILITCAWWFCLCWKFSKHASHCNQILFFFAKGSLLIRRTIKRQLLTEIATVRHIIWTIVKIGSVTFWCVITKWIREKTKKAINLSGWWQLDRIISNIRIFYCFFFVKFLKSIRYHWTVNINWIKLNSKFDNVMWLLKWTVQNRGYTWKIISTDIGSRFSISVFEMWSEL